MLNKTISFALVFLLINCTCIHLAAAVKIGDKDKSKSEAKLQKHAEKIKKGVVKLGESTESKVKVKLMDKTKVSGYVSKIDEDQFTVTDNSGEGHEIEYANVRQIKGNNLHKGVWIGIGAGIALIIIWIVLNQAFKNS